MGSSCDLSLIILNNGSRNLYTSAPSTSRPEYFPYLGFDLGSMYDCPNPLPQIGVSDTRTGCAYCAYNERDLWQAILQS